MMTNKLYVLEKRCTTTDHACQEKFEKTTKEVEAKRKFPFNLSTKYLLFNL